MKQTNDLIFPARNVCPFISSSLKRFSGILKVIILGSVLCLAATGFAQDSVATPDESSLTSLEFVPVSVVNEIDQIQQSKVDEAYSDLELLVPSAGMVQETPSGFAKEGTWRWTIQFGYGLEFNDSINRFVVGGFGFSYFPIDNFSLNVEFDAIYFDQELVNEAGGFNLNLLMRWHYMTRENWSAYIETSVGVVVSTGEVPAAGAGFNFIAQVGTGISVDLGDDVRLLTGLRWHHLSNGRTFDNNPGMDSIYGYMGLSMPF